MHKIKKGIKKKIKGKKDKNDELFTPEELEKYKKEKEEQARRQAEKQEQEDVQEKSEESENHKGPSEASEEGGVAASSETQTASSPAEGDWRNFFAATDSVLKKTTDNLVHIKEVSTVFHKDKTITPVPKETPVSVDTSATASIPAAPSKKWVDLEKGGIDDEDQIDNKEQKPETEPEPEPEPVPLQFIEDLPDVDVDDFTEVFDTTYVDDVESGKVKLHYIPDSPTDTDPNEPDPFDTSVVDKVLHVEEKTKAADDKKPEKKKKKQLVNLGCAVEVLTGNVQGADKPPATPPSSTKRRRVVQKEVDLLGDLSNGEENSEVAEPGVNASEEKAEEATKTDGNNILDDILCVGELGSALPESRIVLCPTPRATSPAPHTEDKDASSVIINDGCESENKEVDLSEFLESSGEEQDNKENGKDLDLKDLVAEFDIIDKSEVINESLVPTELDPIEDEFDAEFAFLAAESVAKAKEKELEVLDDDPFDTSVAAQVLGEEEEGEKNNFEAVFTQAEPQVKPAKPPPPRPVPPKVETETVEEIDPFDTSAAEKHLPIDPFALIGTETELPESLQPQQGDELKHSDSFDPFDTSIAENFGKTELKVLETELLSAAEAQAELLKKSDSDFDFDPRAEERNSSASATCLLTGTDDDSDTKAPVLALSQDIQSDDFDPFDTSIAAKVQIQTLEEELLSQPDQIQQIGEKSAEAKRAAPPRPPPAHLLATTPLDFNPTLEPSPPASLSAEVDDFDPFDTSIADKFGQTELKSIEDELLTKQKETHPVQTGASETLKPKELKLPIKPLRPPSPKCLLATTPLDDQPTLQPQVGENEESSENLPDDFDPFDTSIADQFGKTELKVLENQLLVSSPQKTEDQDFNPREEKKAPPRPSLPCRPPSPASSQCLLTASPARTPVDGKILLPSDPAPTGSYDDFDPFDTSIAEKFGKTELRHLESELLNSRKVHVEDFDNFDPRKEDLSRPSESSKPLRPDRPPRPSPCLLATTPTDGSAALQPSLNSASQPLEGATPEDFDPFDTSIASKLCKTEIKNLEEPFLTKDSTAAVGEAAIVPSPVAGGCGSVDRFFSSSPTQDLGPTLQPVSGQPTETLEDFDPFDTSIAEKFGKTELKTLETELLSDSGNKRNLSDDEFDPREEESKAPRRPPPPVPKPPTPIHLLDSADDHDIPHQPIQAIQPQSAVQDIDDCDPFDTSIAADIAPSKAELKYLETELLNSAQDPFDTSNIA